MTPSTFEQSHNYCCVPSAYSLVCGVVLTLTLALGANVVYANQSELVTDLPLSLVRIDSIEAALDKNLESWSNDPSLSTVREIVILIASQQLATSTARAELDNSSKRWVALFEKVVARLDDKIGADRRKKLIDEWVHGASTLEQVRLVRKYSTVGDSYRALLETQAIRLQADQEIQRLYHSDASVSRRLNLSFEFQEISPTAVSQIANDPFQRLRFVRDGKMFLRMGAPNGSSQDALGGLLPPDEDRGENEEPRSVVLSNAFEIARTTTTQLHYTLVMGENPSFHIKRNRPDYLRLLVRGEVVELNATQPVENVTWIEARAYAEKLSELSEDYAYTLPTEAEWEFAARGATVTPYYWSDSYSDGRRQAHQYAVFDTQAPNPIATKQPNPFGLYDMVGNVAQYCLDIYHARPPLYSIDPVGLRSGLNPLRHITESWPVVIRGGGSFRTDQRMLRSSYRTFTGENSRSPNTGIRLIRVLKKYQ